MMEAGMVKYLIMFLMATSCVRVTNTKHTPVVELEKTKAVAEVDTAGYQISKYEDSDAICYTVFKTEAISISCVRKNQ